MRSFSAGTVLLLSVLTAAAGCGADGSGGQAGQGGGAAGAGMGGGGGVSATGGSVGTGTGGAAGSATGGSVGTGTGGAAGGATGGSVGTGTGGAAGSATGGSVGTGTGGSVGTGGAAGHGTGGSVGTGTGGAAGHGTGGAVGTGTGGAAGGVSGAAGSAGAGVAGQAGGGAGGSGGAACAAGCAVCSDATTCTTCAAGFHLAGGACVACATCASGQYQLSACTPTQDTVCNSCSVCGAGEYQAAACGAVSDTTCAGCDPDCDACTGSGACTSCAAGHFLSGGVCVTCSTCAAGQYQAAACTPTQDTLCNSCSACGASQYSTAACGGTTDTICASCSSCDAGTYQTAACGGSNDSVCATCTTCGAGQYEAGACTTGSNRTCATCTTCGAGQYQTAACAGNSNAACATCTTCGAGEYQTAACGANSDATCATCTTCGAGQYASTACGSNNDAICSACDANCTACTGAGACAACATGYALDAGACVLTGKSCLSIHLANPAAPSGVYQLDPDGSLANTFFAYCDMTADGGGWMKILQYNDAPYTPTASAIGDIAVAGTAAIAKLADASVNSLASLATYREYRFQGDASTKKLFMKSSVPWNDLAQGEGLVLTGTALACEAATNCAYVAVTAPSGRFTIDSNDWTPSSIAGANNQDRYFTDYSATPNCFFTGSTTQRCYDAGVSTGHAMINNLSIWTRELPVTSDGVITYPLNENSGTVVNDTSGNARNAAVLAGTWTPGHTGSALLGALRTNAAVPVTTAVTVSLWVRRDGVGTGYPRILSWNADGLELADTGAANNLGVWTPGLGWHAIGTNFGTGFHHLAVTVGGGTLVVYFDGAQVYTAATTVSLTGQMSIGTRWNGVESWVGALDQVRVYDRALSAAEIATLSQE